MLGFAPISTVAVSAVPQLIALFVATGTLTAAEGFDAKLYVGTREWITPSTDTPANQPFSGTLVKLPTMTRSIINGTSLFGGVTLTWGDVEIINTDGAYDYLAPSYTIDGQPIIFKTGDPTGSYSSFYVVVSLIGISLTVNDDLVTIHLRDQSKRLDVPAQATLYAGTGDLEGDASLARKPKPLVFGQVANITPAPVIPAELVYQVNDGPVQAISAAYDTGLALSGPSTDYGDAASLRAATISDGWYATCTSLGLLRLGAPAQQLTCDVQGDKTGGTYVNTSGTILRRLVGRSTTFADPSELDVVSFANLEVDQPAIIGYYLDTQSTALVSDVIADIMDKIGGWGGLTRLGILQVGVFKAPAGTPIATYDDIDIIDISAVALPTGIDPPPYRYQVSYNKNWTTIANPLPAVPATLAAWLPLPYSLATSTDAQKAVTQLAHAGAQDPPIVAAYFVSQTDALAEASRRWTLTNSNLRLIRVLLADHPFLHDIGQVISLTYSRLGLSTARLGRIVSIIDDPDANSVELQVLI